MILDGVKGLAHKRTMDEAGKAKGGKMCAIEIDAITALWPGFSFWG